MFRPKHDHVMIRNFGYHVMVAIKLVWNCNAHSPSAIDVQIPCEHLRKYLKILTNNTTCHTFLGRNFAHLYACLFNRVTGDYVDDILHCCLRIRTAYFESYRICYRSPTSITFKRGVLCVLVLLIVFVMMFFCCFFFFRRTYHCKP